MDSPAVYSIPSKVDDNKEDEEEKDEEGDAKEKGEASKAPPSTNDRPQAIPPFSSPSSTLIPWSSWDEDDAEEDEPDQSGIPATSFSTVKSPPMTSPNAIVQEEANDQKPITIPRSSSCSSDENVVLDDNLISNSRRFYQISANDVVQEEADNEDQKPAAISRPNSLGSNETSLKPPPNSVPTAAEIPCWNNARPVQQFDAEVEDESRVPAKPPPTLSSNDVVQEAADIDDKKPDASLKPPPNSAPTAAAPRLNAPRPVQQFDAASGKLIATFQSLAAAKKMVGIHERTIARYATKGIIGRDGSSFRFVDTAAAPMTRKPLTARQQTTLSTSVATVPKLDEEPDILEGAKKLLAIAFSLQEPFHGTDIAEVQAGLRMALDNPEKARELLRLAEPADSLAAAMLIVRYARNL